VSAPQLAAGTVVSQKYQLGGCLGYAGSSATYLAMGSDGREVVLKIFDPAIRQRADIMGAIEQTYAATNALPQDVAAPLLDAGYDPSTGAPFSVGERIPFPTLAQLATQRPLGAEELSSILGVLGNVLGQAHARQLFHHALKPTNVFVGFATGHGVRITDFGAGLARAAVPTQEGYALAAPWMAPEQVQGQTPAGAAADVFATGLLMFYALTGRPYWRSCQGTMDLQGWQRELMGPRTPPSARALQLGVQLNSAYDGVLGCALSVDPNQRYRSVSELAQAFEALVGVPPPESQSTMAFPASAYGLAPGQRDGAAGYPPAPGPAAGGYGAPPAPTAGYGAPAPAAGYAAAPAPAAPQHISGQAHTTLPSPYSLPQQQQPPPGQAGTAQYPWGGPEQAQLQQQAAAAGYDGQGGPQPYQGQQPGPSQPQQPGGAYISTQTPAQSQEAEILGDTHAGRPLDPVAAQRRASPNRLAPILVGLVAVVLLGGAAAAWVVMGKRNHPDAATASSASASASAAPTAAPADTASAAPSATPSAAPTETPSAVPADSASAAPADSGAADAGAAPVESTLACEPDCDEVKIDDKVVDVGKPVVIDPGKHTLTASKSGYVTIKENVTVKPGEKIERTFKLKERPAAPTGPAPTLPVKPCGKFLKRGGCK
jgi:hypothetical protein